MISDWGKELIFLVVKLTSSLSPLSWSLFLDGDQVDSILTVRTILEIKSAELAAQCENQVKLNRLTDIYNKMEHTFASYDTTDNVQVSSQGNAG